MGRMTKSRKAMLLKIESMVNTRKRNLQEIAARSDQNLRVPENCSSASLNQAARGLKKLPSLVKLCQRVILKYRLLPEPKRFTAPETFSVVGGKPLRKRSETTPPELLKKEKQRKKGRDPKSLATLCQIVIDEYNILPEFEETRPSTSQQQQLIMKKRGKPRKPPIKKDGPKPRRGRPRKDAANDSSTKTIRYATYLRESHSLRTLKVEEELKLPDDIDPLQNEEGFTIVIKEECVDEEDEESFEEVPTLEMPRATSRGIVLNPTASMEIPGPSRGTKSMAKFVTVVMDEYQAFANSIAEQLRTLPPSRALLLQLDIQSMVDNEKQLLRDES